MFSIAELTRKVKNSVRITTLIATKSKDGKALATVKVGSLGESLEFPVLNFGNSFKKHWIPIRKDEQVLVFHPFGNANKGYILRGVFSQKIKEPERSDIDIEVIKFEDGSNLSHNVNSSIFKIDIHGNMSVVSDENLKIVADVMIVTSENFSIDGAGNLTTKGTVTDGKSCNLNKHQHLIPLKCTTTNSGGCKGPGKTTRIVCSSGGLLLKSGGENDDPQNGDNIGAEGVDAAKARAVEFSPISSVCKVDLENIESKS